VEGAFKTPTLRNVELTGPYFHHGGAATLEQVVEFYARAGDFGSSTNARDFDPDVQGFPLVGTDKADLVAFLKSLTDPRVRLEQAPFDHPELPLKEGLVGDHVAVVDDGTGKGIPVIEIVPATGAAGGPPLPDFASQLGAAITVAPLRRGPDGLELALFLDKRPSAEVTLELQLSDPALEVRPAELRFTADGWRSPQVVEIVPRSAQADAAPGARLTVRALSLDPAYRRLETKVVALEPLR
jgi:hypothetical protein